MKTLTTRFAPTPSGYLHIGNCVTFAITWLMTRAVGGKIHLRIDDLDAERTRLEYLEDIFRTLEWLELDYDFGPTGVEDFTENLSQHHRIGIYNKFLNRLVEKKLVYACTCSRKEIRSFFPSGQYPNTCRNLNSDLNTPNAAWRVKLPETNKIIEVNDLMYSEKKEIKSMTDDFVVRQKNGLPAYHLASVVDDCILGVNFIVRGEDLFPSTFAQVYLAELLELKTFKENLFVHLPLIKKPNGEKISKSSDLLGEWKLHKTKEERDYIFKMAASWLKVTCKNFTAKEVLKVYSESLHGRH